MKKTILAIAAVAVMFGFTQCSKQPVQPHYTGYAGDLYVSYVNVGATKADNNNNSKVSCPDASDISSNLDLWWETGDQLHVFDGTTDAGTLNINGGMGTANGNFVGSITATPDHTIKFIYGGSSASISGGTYSEDFLGQTGEVKGNGKSLMNMLVLTGEAKYKENISDYNVRMTVPYAILYLDLSALNTSSTPKDVKIYADGDADPVATVKNVTNTSTGMYVALPTPNLYSETPNPEAMTEVKYSFEYPLGNLEYKWKIAQNTYYTKDNGEGVSTGAAIVIAPDLPALPSSHGGYQNIPAGGLNP